MRILPSKTLVLLGAWCGVSACMVLPTERDVPEIAERYTHRNMSECTSWLTSHVTGYTYCASPAFAVTSVKYDDGSAGGTAEEMDETMLDLDGLSTNGAVVYDRVCKACHQANGEGMAGIWPPLAGAGDYYGDAQNHARIVVHGLNGEIVVKGETYNGVMPAQGGLLSDYEIAAVLTYVRHSWGNDDGMVSPEDVASVR